MQIQVLLFGIIADVIGKASFKLDISENTSVLEFKKALIKSHPALKNYTSFAIAVNETYALDNFILNNKDIIAIIPPVSGG